MEKNPCTYGTMVKIKGNMDKKKFGMVYSSTIFLTDSALTNYVVPLTTTYCCVEASKLKDHFGNFQIDVKSGTAVLVRNGILIRIVL